MPYYLSLSLISIDIKLYARYIASYSITRYSVTSAFYIRVLALHYTMVLQQSGSRTNINPKVFINLYHIFCGVFPVNICLIIIILIFLG